jgi:hypothetical protein
MMITQLTNSEKLSTILKVIDLVAKKGIDPWAKSIYAPFKSKGSNYAIGDFGEILVCELLKLDGVDAEIYKKDKLDIRRGSKQDEVKTSAISDGKGWFNQIKFSEDKKSGAHFDYIYFVGIYSDNSLQIWRAKNSEDLKNTFELNNSKHWNNKFPEKLDKSLWECFFEYNPTTIDVE